MTKIFSFNGCFYIFINITIKSFPYIYNLYHKKLLNNINNLLLGDLFNYYINIKFEETLLNKNSFTRITTKINNEVARFTFQVLLPFFEILKDFCNYFNVNFFVLHRANIYFLYNFIFCFSGFIIIFWTFKKSSFLWKKNN